MTSSLALVEQALDEPIDLDTARLHLLIDAEGSPPSHPQDALVSAMITAAREWCESFTGLQIVGRIYEVAMDGWVDQLVLPRQPARAIVSIDYIDQDGDLQALDPAVYTLKRILPTGETDAGAVATLCLADGQAWPACRGQAGDVRITFETGFDQPDASPVVAPLPGSIRSAMLLLLAHLYDHRSEVSQFKLESIPLGAASLLRPYRVRLGMA